MAPGLRREELTGPIAAALEQAGFELVDLKVVPRPGSLSVQIFIDHQSGMAAVTLGDCSRASRVIQDGVDLDRYLPGRYLLEVSSPGVDRPLKRPEHTGVSAGNRSSSSSGRSGGGNSRARSARATPTA